MAKWKRDVIYGVVLIACCAFGVVETLDMRISGNPVFITRPDVYLWKAIRSMRSTRQRIRSW